jgi:hypothetical protein
MPIKRSISSRPGTRPEVTTLKNFQNRNEVTVRFVARWQATAASASPEKTGSTNDLIAADEY